MKMIVEQEIFDKYPGVRLGVVVAIGLGNEGKGKYVKQLRAQEAMVRKEWEGKDIASDSRISEWREIYRQFGSKPNEFRSSIEALVRRVSKGGELSDINPLVNLYNYLSLKHVMPYGGEDLDRVKGDIRLVMAQGNETGIYLGSEASVACDPGEVAYVDELGFICRKWNWREGKRTMLTEQTKNVVLVTEATGAITDEQLRVATEELAQEMQKLKGNMKIFYLDKNNPVCEWEFMEGQCLSGTEAKKLRVGTRVETPTKAENKAEDKQRVKRELGGVAGEIAELVGKAVKALGLLAVEFGVEYPKEESHGDYSSNVALLAYSVQRTANGKSQWGSSRELAEEIVEKLHHYTITPLHQSIEKIEVAGAGFINFYLKKEFFLTTARQACVAGYGKNVSGKDKLAIVEYSSPNIAKPFTIGHLRSTVIGDSVANILEINGWKVMRDNHLGDWGTQFGKQIAAIKKWGDIKVIGEAENPVKELVALYVKFHEEAEKDPTLEDEARAWFVKLEKGSKEARDLWQKCIDWSWKEFGRIYELLNIHHSEEFNNGRGLGESFFEDKMGEVLKILDKQDWYKEGKEGAKLVFFPDDKYSPAMILKKDGATLYHTRDLATDKYRLDKYHPDLVVNEVGMEQQLYFQQLYEIEKMLGWYSGAQRVHVMHGMFRFKEGKMSTRKGNVIWLEEVLGEAIKRAGELGKEGKNVAEDVGIGALKWNDLKGEARRDIVFDWEEILNMKGNSGPFVQYTYARASSILRKVGAKKTRFVTLLQSYEPCNEEMSILRWIYRYPEVVTEAGAHYAPHLVSTYIYELAQRFNSFYQACRVEESGKVNELRYLLTQAVTNVLQSGLGLLGIVAPEEM